GGLQDGEASHALRDGFELYVCQPDLTFAGEDHAEEDEHAIFRYIYLGGIGRPILCVLKGALLS
nr:hypothetical protein [Chloroflexota bacterium]